MNPFSEDTLTRIFKTSTQYPNRLVKREDKNHEFKESFNFASMPMYLKTIASFANNEGGYLIFGVKDKPHELLGLYGKNLTAFEELKVEKFTEKIQEYFSPDIEWTSCLFEFRGLCFGIIYIFPLKSKPAICKKNLDNSNNKYALKEADIYYRYGGRSEKIKYPELQRIIDEKRKNEEKQWLHFLLKAARVGVENASIVDIAKGEIKDSGGSIIIDEDLLSQMRFVKEGKFVEKDGAPTLRLMGEIETVESGKFVVSPTKKVVKAIEQTDIVESFLRGDVVSNPTDYIKRICSATTGNLPVYYYIKAANISIENAISIVEQTTSRGTAKKTLLSKLKDNSSPQELSFPKTDTEASRQKIYYMNKWISQNIPHFEVLDKDLVYCLEAILYIEKAQISTNSSYICSTLLSIYKQFYEAFDGITAHKFRTAICYIDAMLFM